MLSFLPLSAGEEEEEEGRTWKVGDGWKGREANWKQEIKFFIGIALKAQRPVSTIAYGVITHALIAKCGIWCEVCNLQCNLRSLLREEFGKKREEKVELKKHGGDAGFSSGSCKKTCVRFGQGRCIKQPGETRVKTDKHSKTRCSFFRKQFRDDLT